MKGAPFFYVENFGCRATQSDGAAIVRQFQERGLEHAATSQQADLVVLNTCTVTAAADQDARAAIRRIRRKNPNAQIVVTGCYAQRAPQEIAALPGVARVIGNSHKHELARLALATSRVWAPQLEENSCAIENIPRTTSSFLPLSVLATDKNESGNADQIFISDIFAHTELLAAPVFEQGGQFPGGGGRTRPNLKIQDGCGNRCSFCIIPSVRGNSRSLQKARILQEVHALVAAGYREVVISGINLGRWGRDLKRTMERQRPCGSDGFPKGLSQLPRLESLISSILEETTLEKLRISSVEPMDWSDALIRLMAASPRIAKHAHVPMQSGSDAVLRRMHRRYRPWHYREKIERIREAMPDAAIGADVMVGFPGETEAEFAETRRLVEDLPFTYLHVFTYSARPGTRAAEMPNQVPVNTARERNHVLRELAAQKKLAFMRSFVGTTVEAITLDGKDAGYTESLTDNYLKLRIRGRHAPNLWLPARIESVEDGLLLGSRLPRESTLPA
jgi:threonylcarbamoyladenosine tRNA methylthiotransferase MtaB